MTRRKFRDYYNTFQARTESSPSVHTQRRDNDSSVIILNSPTTQGHVVEFPLPSSRGTIRSTPEERSEEGLKMATE